MKTRYVMGTFACLCIAMMAVPSVLIGLLAASRNGPANSVENDWIGASTGPTIITTDLELATIASSGSGTQLDPYIISGKSYDGGGAAAALTIDNTLGGITVYVRWTDLECEGGSGLEAISSLVLIDVNGFSFVDGNFDGGSTACGVDLVSCTNLYFYRCVFNGDFGAIEADSCLHLSFHDCTITCAIANAVDLNDDQAGSPVASQYWYFVRCAFVGANNSGTLGFYDEVSTAGDRINNVAFIASNFTGFQFGIKIRTETNINISKCLFSPGIGTAGSIAVLNGAPSNFTIDSNAYRVYFTRYPGVTRSGWMNWSVLTTPYTRDTALGNAWTDSNPRYSVDLFGVSPPGASVVADFSANATTVYTGHSVKFSFTGTNGSLPMSWEWYFGDGSSNSTYGQPTHAYAASGNYTVALTATDSGANSDFKKKVAYVHVYDSLVADFSSNATIIDQGDTVHFWYTGTNGSGGLTYEWYFTDGMTNLTAASPLKIFLVVGSYTVTLTVTDTLQSSTARYVNVILVYWNSTSPFNITSNADFQWYASIGNGSAANPWIISGFVVDCGGIGDGIGIAGTTDYAVLQDGVVNNTGAGVLSYAIGILFASNIFVVDVNCTSGTYGIVIVASGYVVIYQCLVGDFIDNIAIDGSYDVVIADGGSVDATSFGITVENGLSGNTSAYIDIVDETLYNTVEDSGDNLLYLPASVDARIEGCVFDNGSVVIQSPDTMLRNCTFENTGFILLDLLTTDDILVDRCSFVNYTAGSAVVGGATGTNRTVENCLFYGTGTTITDTSNMTVTHNCYWDYFVLTGEVNAGYSNASLLPTGYNSGSMVSNDTSPYYDVAIFGPSVPAFVTVVVHLSNVTGTVLSPQLFEYIINGVTSTVVSAEPAGSTITVLVLDRFGVVSYSGTYVVPHSNSTYNVYVIAHYLKLVNVSGLSCHVDIERNGITLRVAMSAAVNVVYTMLSAGTYDLSTGAATVVVPFVVMSADEYVVVYSNGGSGGGSVGGTGGSGGSGGGNNQQVSVFYAIIGIMIGGIVIVSVIPAMNYVNARNALPRRGNSRASRGQ